MSIKPAVISPLKTQAVARLQETAADAEFQRLKKRVTSINKDLEALKGKTDKTSNTKRDKLNEDLRVTRAQKKKLSDKNKKSTAATTDDPVYVVRRIRTLFATKPLPKEVKDSKEPYRAAMHYLGYGKLDGTKWWNDVMDLIG